MERPPEIKFSSFEDFAIKTEQKENPRTMPCLSYSIAVETSGAQEAANDMLRRDLSRLFRESSMGKELIETQATRDFLKTTWQRDSFLYFNGVYFPWRWIDTKGQFRPELEAYVLKKLGKKDAIDLGHLARRAVTDMNEGVFAMGEGGLYFPDHDNNILLISRGIIAKKGALPDHELDEKIRTMHLKIFGDDTKVGILSQPEGTHHLDTHLSVIPKTNIVLIEHNYYRKIEESGDLEVMRGLGYEVIPIPETQINCPLNILYMENSLGKICAFLHPQIPSFVKATLLEHGIETYEVSDEVAVALDNKDGGLRCVTNELHTKDPKFLRRLGLGLNLQENPTLP